MNRTILIAATLLFGTTCAAAATVPLPELDKAAAWTVESPEKKILETSDIAAWLAVEVNVDKDNPCRLLLKKPVDIPDGSELVWNGTIKDIRELLLYALVSDSKGTLFLFNQESHSFSKKSMFLGGRFAGGLFRVGEVRFRTKGLRAFERQSYVSVGQAGKKPVPPLKLVGLQLDTESVKPLKTTVYFRNFRLTNADHHSKLYYQFSNQECFGDIDGKPSLSYGDIVGSLGYKEKQFKLDWGIRRQFDGQPFLTGSASFDIDQKSALPVPLQLAKRIEFPVTEPGTYWITVKVRANSEKTLLTVKEDEHRLYVMNGDKQDLPKEITAEQRIGGSSIRISPERKNLVWTEKEPWILNVKFFDAKGTVGKVEVKDKTGTVLSQKEAEASGEVQNLAIDLSGLKSGIFQVTATQLKDGKTVDQSARTIGRKESFSEEKFVLPAGIPTARQLIDGEKPQFYFDAQIGNRGPDEVEKIKKTMDVTAPIAKSFEVRAFWREVETLPGVYDFSEIETLMEHAKKLGTAVHLFISFGPPEWVPSHFTQNPEGEIFGHNTYLFHGARLNMYHSPVIRDAAVRFVNKLVSHFRNNPAMHSYYILIEHPGEASYKGWFEGFDQFTLGNFRIAMEKKYQTVAAANKAWKTQFKGFADAMPPLPGAKAANQLWLDWISFREERVEDFKVECVQDIRKLDPHRMIMVYGGAIEKLKPYNVMTANGGCDKPDQFAHGMIEAVDSGMPQRAEEVSVSNWAADYHTRLDTSLFSMMLGGGQNSFCKMFFPTDTYLRSNSLEPLRKDPIALDRFEKFMPIWAELRSSRPLAGDVRYFSDDNNDRLVRKSTFSGGGDAWFTRFFMDSQVPFWVAPGKNWKQAKLLVLPYRLSYLENKLSDELADYVKNGGNILMGAEAGRYSVEDDNADWTLLKKFGFNPPETVRENIYGTVSGAPGSGLEKYSNIGTVRHIWTSGAQPGKTLAVFSTLQNSPAITVKEFGKGKVFMIWAREVQPPGNYDEKAHPVLRTVAEMCGADLPTECDSRYFWTNLMKDQKSDTWYLLVMRSNYGKDDANSAVVKTKLPAGNYKITELIDGKVNLDKSAAQLAGEGLQVKLGKREVAIYKLKKN
ncbi:MAG: beta-galactosidase [Victivallales bacterium]|jgi:hypothetical protein